MSSSAPSSPPPSSSSPAKQPSSSPSNKDTTTTATTKSNSNSSSAWDAQYAKLLEFYQQHQHCHVPRKGSTAALAKWIGKQRVARKEHKLTIEQMEKLNACHFTWQSKQELDNATWNQRFESLKQYQQEFGNTNVPQKYPNDAELGTWVANQRRRYNQNTLRQDRKQLLDTLHFNWCIKTSNSDKKRGPLKSTVYDAQWETMFDRLVEYKQQHGHTNVPQNAEGDLGMWVSTQRRYFHKKTWIPGRGMREDRKAKLDSIGFEWTRSQKQKKSSSNEEEEEEGPSKKAKLDVDTTTTTTDEPTVDDETTETIVENVVAAVQAEAEAAGVALAEEAEAAAASLEEAVAVAANALVQEQNEEEGNGKDEDDVLAAAI